MLFFIKNLILFRKRGDLTWSYLITLILAVIVIGLIFLMAIKSKGDFGEVNTKLEDVLP